jgi:hypothetical protein
MDKLPAHPIWVFVFTIPMVSLGVVSPAGHINPAVRQLPEIRLPPDHYLQVRVVRRRKEDRSLDSGALAKETSTEQAIVLASLGCWRHRTKQACKMPKLLRM